MEPTAKLPSLSWLRPLGISTIDRLLEPAERGFRRVDIGGGTEPPTRLVERGPRITCVDGLPLPPLEQGRGVVDFVPSLRDEFCHLRVTVLQ